MPHRFDYRHWQSAQNTQDKFCSTPEQRLIKGEQGARESSALLFYLFFLMVRRDLSVVFVSQNRVRSARAAGPGRSVMEQRISR